jgi:mono/diheme cytochrome c family protein
MEVSLLMFWITLQIAALPLVAGADAGAIEKGKALFATNCQSCHGKEGRGDGPASAYLHPKPIDLAKGKFDQGDSEEEIFKSISEGEAGTPMPGFEQLSEEDRRALAQFVRSLRQPEQPKRAESPPKSQKR